MLAQTLYKPSGTQKEEDIISSEVGHAVIMVSDHEKSLRFYKDIMGFKPIFQSVLEGKELDQITGIPQVKLKVCLLGKENVNAGKVDIMQCLSHKAKPLPRDTSISDCGLRFIAFRVDDIDRACNVLKGEGIRFISEPVTVTIESKKARMVLARDFDDVFMEFFQDV
jgi:catechol 2,3-dioxygenase-like lactoylglutathione lyase family enzyme